MDLSLRTIRKNIAALSVFAIIASMLVVTGVANAAAVDYLDIEGGEWYEADVNWGLDNGVLDDTQVEFRAPDNASRAEFFTMVARGAAIPEVACDELLAPDMTADHWGCPYMTALFQEGVISGDGVGSETEGAFRPDHNIVRAEAAKVVVEAYGLTGTRLGSDVFTDVMVGDWFDSYMGIANENCVFRGVDNGNTVEPAREINRAESVVVVQRGANPTTDCAVPPTIDAGALTIALDGSTPDTVSIPQNGANIPYSVFKFTASNDEDVNVEQLVITRAGLGLPGDFTNLKLYVDGVQKGSEKTISTSTNTATFNLSSDPILVPAGSSVLVEVRADMSGVSGSQNQLCIIMDEDVLGYGADSTGEVSVTGPEVCGNYMETTSAAVGTLTYTVSQPSIAEINVGDTDIAMTKVRMDMATEDVEVERITFKQTGSAGMEDFANVSLWISGSMYADNPTWEGDFLTFDLTGNVIEIAKGNSKTVELHADVVGGLASTANFDIYRDWHIEGTGTVYGYGVNVVECTGTCSPLSATPLNRNIVGGNVAFSLSSSNPVTGDVKKGANDHDFTRFNISTGGDGVTVRKLSLTVKELDIAPLVVGPAVVDATLAKIDDVKIWTKNSSDEWYVVAGPNDITLGTNPQTISFTDTFDVPAATTQEFMITADIANDAAADDDYDIDVADVTLAGNAELEYLSDGTPLNVTTEVTGGMLDGNVMTVNTPTLTVAGSATPGAKIYVRNTTDKDLVAYDMTASTADDLRVTGLVVTCSDSGLPGDCATAFQSLYLYEKDGSTLTQLDGPRSMSDAGSGEGTVTFSMNETIAKGTTKRFLVRSDLSSGAISDTYTFGTSSVTAEDTDSSTATIVGVPVVAANTVQIVANGNMSSQGVSDAALMARVVAGLSSDEPVLKLKFSADELEAWYVKKLQFDLLQGTDADLTHLLVNYVDNLGDPQVTSGVVSGGVVNFEGLNIYVPAGSSQTIDISLDMGDVTPGGAVAGDILQVQFSGATGTFQAIGASSANPVIVSVDVASNELRLAKSFPVVSRDELSTALSNGEKELYSATIAADDAGDISIKQLCFDVNETAGLTITGYKLFRDAEGVDLATAGEVTVTSGAFCGAGTGVLVQWHDGVVGGEDEITAGTSTTYVLKGTVAGSAGGESINTTLVADVTAGSDQGVVVTNAAGYLVGGNAEGFVWSDLSLPGAHVSDEIGPGTSLDFLDGYLVEGLASAGGQVLSQ